MGKQQSVERVHYVDRTFRSAGDSIDILTEHVGRLVGRLVAIRRELPEESGLILDRHWVTGEFKRFERLYFFDLAGGIEGDEQSNVVAHGTAEILLDFINIPYRIVLPAEDRVAVIAPKVLVLPGFGYGESNRDKLRNGQFVERRKEFWRARFLNWRPIERRVGSHYIGSSGSHEVDEIHCHDRDNSPGDNYPR